VAIVIDVDVADEPGFDDELAALALAADPDAPIDDDATPFGAAERPAALLPEWYMPAPGSIRRTRGRVLAVGVIVGALLVVNGAGLCVTYGWPEIAW
jgi:hypothetical protein